MDLMAYDVPTLITHVLIVALASVGIVEWLKNWLKPKRRNFYAVLGLLVLMLNVVMQLPCMSKMITWSWNLFSLGLAFMQFGHAALIKLPEKLINKALNIKDKEDGGHSSIG